MKKLEQSLMKMNLKKSKVAAVKRKMKKKKMKMIIKIWMRMKMVKMERKNLNKDIKMKEASNNIAIKWIVNIQDNRVSAH